MPIRVVLTEPYRSHSVGESVILPDHVADCKVRNGSAKLANEPRKAKNKAAVPKAAKKRKRKKKAEEMPPEAELPKVEMAEE